MNNSIKIDANVVSAKMGKGEPCEIYFSRDKVAWVAPVGGWRIDVGTTGGVIHLVMKGDIEPNFEDFKAVGPVYWLEENGFDELSKEFVACLN